MLALTVAAGALFSPARPQERTVAVHVRYENAGANAKSVLADLVKLTNIPLAASTETAGEILAVRFQGETLDTVMKRIAWAVDGNWKPEGQGYVLFRSAEQLRAEEKRELELRVAAYRAGIEGMRKDVQAATEMTADTAGKMAHALAARAASNSDGPALPLTVKERRPIGRALARLILLLDPRELADIPADCKVAYSTQPTRAQRPLGGDALQVFQEFNREQTLWMDAASTMKIPTVGANPNAFDAPNIGGFMLTAAKSGGENDPVQLLLRIADPNGRVLARASLPVIPGPIADPLSPKLRKPSDPALPVPLEAAELLQAADWRNRPVLSAQTRSRACNPEQFDPLSLVTGRLLLLVAESTHQSLVADLDDDMLIPPTDGKQIRAGEFIDAVTSLTAERNVAGDWIGIRPILSAQARINRVDRAVLGRFLRRCARPRPLSIDESASFSLDFPDSATNGMPSTMRRLVTPCTTVEDFDDRVLRFYGLLDDTLRNIAAQRGLRMDALPPGAASVLASILTEPSIDLDARPSSGPESGNGQIMPGPVLREPTQCLPDGPPGAGTVHIEVFQEGVAGTKQTRVGDASFGAQAMTPQELAWQRFTRDRPGTVGPAESPQPPIDRLMFGSRTRYQITFQFTPEISLTVTLDSTDFGNEQEIAYGDLPDDFRKQAEASYGQYAEQFKTAKSGNLRPAKPPTGGLPPPR